VAQNTFDDGLSNDRRRHPKPDRRREEEDKAILPKRNKHFETVIDYHELRAQRARLEMEYTDVITAVEGDAPSTQKLCRFLRGDEDMKVKTIIRLAAALGLRVKVTFEVAEDVGAERAMGGAKKGSTKCSPQ
jgi:hypothetical protein